MPMTGKKLHLLLDYFAIAYKASQSLHLTVAIQICIIRDLCCSLYSWHSAMWAKKASLSAYLTSMGPTRPPSSPTIIALDVPLPDE